MKRRAKRRNVPAKLVNQLGLLLELDVDEADLLDGLGRDLVALADDDLALLDRVEDGLDAHPGPLLAGLGLGLVVGDVGGEEEVGEVDEQHLRPRGEVQAVDLGGEPLLGLLDVQDVVRPDRPLARRPS